MTFVFGKGTRSDVNFLAKDFAAVPHNETRASACLQSVVPDAFDVVSYVTMHPAFDKKGIESGNYGRNSLQGIIKPCNDNCMPVPLLTPKPYQ